MANNSLQKLSAAFRQWRRAKHYRSEPAPERLVARARRAVSIYGFAEVVKATGLVRSQIDKDAPKRKVKRSVSSMPTFSRVEIGTPHIETRCPLAEAETSDGVKLRIFSVTPETIELMSTICRMGGGGAVAGATGGGQ